MASLRPFALVLSATLLFACSKSGKQETDGAITDAATKDAATTDSGTTCQVPTLKPLGSNFFADISEASGIRASKAGTDRNHPRLTIADINGDGFDDVLVHTMWPDTVNQKKPFHHQVYLNNGDGSFSDFTAQSGLENIQAGFFAFADVDNDGDQDCFAGLDVVVSPHRSQLLLNDGKGKFTVKLNSGLENPANASVTGNALFADFNGDGKLDVYFGNGHTIYPAVDQLFFGNGDGTFEQVTQTHLKGNVAHPSNAVVACDYDSDGDLDIFVGTYGVSSNLGHNMLWENDGKGSFTEVALKRGFHAMATGNSYLSSTGNGTLSQPNANSPAQWVGSNGFGIDCDDINFDGHPDILLATISHPDAIDFGRSWSDPSMLLINQGPDKKFSFVNEFTKRKLPFNEGDITSKLIDIDADGRLDIATSRDKKYETRYPETAFDQRGWFGLYHQQTDGTFKAVVRESGMLDPQLATSQMKGTGQQGWSDFDGDGDLDLFVYNNKNFIWENKIGNQNPWVAIKLEGDGVKVNRDGIGVRLTVRFASTKQLIQRVVKSSNGTYSEGLSRWQHIGLGDIGCDPTFEVRWTDGKVETFSAADVPLKHFVTIRYGSGVIDLKKPRGSFVAPDGGMPDATVPDATVPDAGVDAATPDATVPDAGVDAATPDATAPDAAVPDATVADAAITD